MKLLFLAILIPPVFLMISCSSVSRKDDVLDSRTETLLLLYENAIGAQSSNPEAACQGFLKVAQDSKFNLAPAGLLRAYLVCPKDQILPPISESLLNENPWLKSLSLQVDLKIATEQNHAFNQAKVYHRLGLKSNLNREKVKYYLRAKDLIENETVPEAIELKADLQARLEKIAPRLIANPQPEDYQKVAVDLISQREFEKGRNLLQEIIKNKKSSNEEKYFALKALRNSFKTQQKREDHLLAAEALAKWTEKKVSSLRTYEAYVTLARAQWTVGNRKAAEKHLLHVQKILKGKVAMDEVFFVQGKMAEEIQDFETAIKVYSKAQETLKSRSAFFDRILFSKAWCSRKLKRYDEALLALEELKNKTQDPFEKSKYVYWHARTLFDLDQKDLATQNWKELGQQDPLGFYGLLSFKEINQPIPPMEVESLAQSPLKKAASIKSEEHALIRNLVFVGEKQLLEEYLKTFVTDLRLKRESDLETWLYYLKAYAKADLYLPLFAELGTLTPEMRNQLLRRYPELLFPRKYLESVQKWSDKLSVSSELILSIMRQESAFDPNARSPADAMGLMQVLPSVAKEHEKTVGTELLHFEDLFTPDFNISMGAAVLKDLKAKYNGQFVLMAAAYNANDKAIRGWLLTRLFDDPIAFIEDIPYEETRAYIKLVLRNFIFYSRLNNPKQTFDFPVWAFEGLKEYRDIVKND